VPNCRPAWQPVWYIIVTSCECQRDCIIIIIIIIIIIVVVVVVVII